MRYSSGEEPPVVGSPPDAQHERSPTPSPYRFRAAFPHVVESDRCSVLGHVALVPLPAKD